MTFKLMAFTLALIPATLMAQTDFDVTINKLTSYGPDSKVETIREARLQVSVESTGSSFRPDCFKEYDLNLPFSAQTVPYRISQNYTLDIQGTRLLAKNVLNTTKSLRVELKDKVNLGCGTDVSGILLIKGELQNGDAFKSSPMIYLKEGQLIIETGSVQTTLSQTSTTKVDVISTVFFGRNWDMVWEDADPYTDSTQYNY